jgi:hypothetical protein
MQTRQAQNATLTHMATAIHNNAVAVNNNITAIGANAATIGQNGARLTQLNLGVDTLRGQAANAAMVLQAQNQYLFRENRALRRDLDAQQRRSAQLEFLNDLSVLGPNETLRMLQEYFQVLPPPTGSMVLPRLVIDTQGQVTGFRTSWGRSISLTTLLQQQYPQGCTWSQLQRLLNDHGIPPSLQRLREVSFTALGIA